MDYNKFLEKKAITLPPSGLDVVPELPHSLFNYQHDIVSWSLKRGRAALFAGTGLGKTRMQISYADAIVRHTNKPALILTPLAVANQFVAEGAKVGIEVIKCATQSDIKGASIYVCNYQKLQHFDANKFGCILLDESSILKNETGKYRSFIIDTFKNTPFRLAATATPSPNDFMELGNHSQFCGIMLYTDMLSTFFVHDSGQTQQWRLKGYAEEPFWRWMASWSVMLQSPADLGYDGSTHELPKLHKHEHIVKVDYKPCIESGLLFPMEAQSLSERLSARRSTIEVRCEKAAELATTSEPAVIWCNLNSESELLTKITPDAVSVSGSDSDAKKEEILAAFSNGDIRVLVTKPSICGFGMNWQHCNNTIFVGLNDSFEQVYQAVRRFWRFGQKREVHAHFIAAETEGAVLSNIYRKERQAEHMMSMMIKHMADLNAADIRGAVRETTNYIPNETLTIPNFLRG